MASRYMWLLFLSLLEMYHSKVHIKIISVIPADSKYLFSSMRVLPAGKIALQTIQDRKILPKKYKIDLNYGDSKCDEAYAMNEAFTYYMKGKVNAFLGPVCDYAAAPVARQIAFWNLPIVSTGAFARDFGARKTEKYPLLTRAGANDFQSMNDYLLSLFMEFHFGQIKLVYDLHGQQDIVPMLCHFVGDSIVNGHLNKNITVDFIRFHPNTDWPTRILLDEVGNKFAGRIFIQCILSQMIVGPYCRLETVNNLILN